MQKKTRTQARQAFVLPSQPQPEKQDHVIILSCGSCRVVNGKIEVGHHG